MGSDFGNTYELLRLQQKETTPSEQQTDAAAYQQQNRASGFIETDALYYSLADGMVYFSEKSEPCFYLLCGKPDCSHNDENCDAYVGTALGYWDGMLYGADVENLRVFKMNLDGTNHAQIAELETPLGSNGSAGGVYEVYFHNNHLFYEVMGSEDFFYQVDLDTGETTQILTEWSGAVGTSFRVELETFYEDCILFCLVEQSSDAYTLHKYEISSGVRSQICPWDKYFFQKMEGDTLYYYDKYKQSFAEYSLTSGQTVYPAAAEMPYYQAAYYDTDWIYVVEGSEGDIGLNRTFSVYDRDYHLINSLKLKGSTDFRFACAEGLFFSAFVSNKITNYISMEQLAAGANDLSDVKDPYSLR